MKWSGVHEVRTLIQRAGALRDTTVVYTCIWHCGSPRRVASPNLTKSTVRIQQSMPRLVKLHDATRRRSLASNNNELWTYE